MLITRLAAIAITLAVICQIAIGGTTGKIAGEIRDAATREALIGVTVSIEGTRFGAATNLDGYYVILNVPPGEYTVIVSAVGYTRHKVENVKVNVDLTTTMDFQLKQITVEVGEEIVVTAERPLIRKDLTSTEARVDASQIQALPVQEVREVLRLQAGVSLGRDGAIHIRGGRASEVAYWVDGISISDAYDGSQTVQVDNNSVQELQVISGTFNAEYGQAMSGIVNIVTKEGAQKFSGNLIAYSGDYITSYGYRWKDRVYPLISPDPSFDPTTMDLYYGLDELKPFSNHNIEGSVSGPIPLFDMSFYVSGRYYKSDGWLYGSRIFNTNGTTIPEITPDRFVLDAQGNIVAVRLPDFPAAMNGRTRYSGQAKLTIPIGGEIKLSLTGIGSAIDYRDYSHDWFLLPDGDVKKYDRAHSLAALWTHSLGATSFYTINLAYFFKGFKEYLYENPFDERYIVDPNATAHQNYEFISAGTNNHRFKRKTESRVAKIDYTNQISRLHQIRAGVEGKMHRLYLEDYSLIQDPNTLLPAIPEINGPLYEEYTRKPIELSAYIQDKLEYERMIVNIGLRFDYFDPRAQVLADPQDPNVYLPQKPEYQGLSLEERKAIWYKDARPKYLVSPRFGISYPITDRGVLHFSYGHFLQIPSFINLYQRPEYKVTTASGIQGVYGNPDLEAQRTVMYEFGLQQQMSDLLSFDITAFYRDTRSWVTTSPPIPVRDPDTFTSSYVTYVNRDYANSRGITISVNKRPSDYWTMSLSYTYQSAEGSNSNPDDELAAQRNNQEPPRALTPLDWDQTHIANLNVGVGQQGDWGVFILGRYASGLPYTPVINQAEARGEDAARAVQRNSRRQPDFLSFDLRVFKDFDLGPLNFSVFAKVFNLFDRRNEMTVYGQTGRAFATPQALGAANISTIGRINPVEAYIIRPDYYSEPREVQLGIELNF